ncbi:molybdopterin oxidoreductase family protein [Acidithiobacillus sulfuriphilus]|jgi:anaerobic selenocysteine-containing dehydrogenase|uniref:Formate dehydrogenase n=2 Tax=Acidithiobacillus sulfuriphilus TaxID=1867749 RepID=A0A3M8RHU9_9PROT|nr:molybdopterin oxidoreductase family protein [Acidithiobacillus sulfuriphilus]MCL5979712.1 molybdopterin oxidoreductase family protein [Gammaproteobacteria bacterium]RNF67893.1 formate dehydrogenase [Acidithiobacillus sulfuriphilus]
MATVMQFEDHGKQEIKYTTCYMCACRCGIKVTVEDNKVRFIQGNRNHPINQGVLCAKGSAGIMKQYSPGKLRNPLIRKPGSERGAGEFEEISWDEALELLTKRLSHIRATDPNKLAFFTGRDQMQALTGLWAQQFGTLNWSAHGGFCSVNMATAGLYMLGHAFWEFGDPDWERTKYFMLWGVAEDHSSNPMKIGLEKLKRHGGKFVGINPARTGYQAIADEWVPIKPGTDGMFALSMVHVLLNNELFDWDFLVRYTNAPFLVVNTPGQRGDGLIARDADGHPLVWDLRQEAFVNGMQAGISPAMFGEFAAPDGRPVRTVMSILAEKYTDEQFSPKNASKITGIPAETIERLALEMAHVAFQESIEIECEWTDWAGRKQDRFIGRPVSMHAMRGISAHSNGLQSARAIHLLQVLLGTIDCPGGFRSKAPYPKHVPPPNKPAQDSAPNTPLKSLPLGFPTAPEDLVIDADGNPRRIDKAYSWEAPIANHGLMHMVITNAVNHDPYAIDTLIFFMANMSWNSTMNTANVQEMLKSKDEQGEYKIPFLVVVDAFHSEMVNFADLVLPDTTYLERYDAISLLDRPISEPDAVCDSIRHPLLQPDRNVRPWQEVMVDLAGRLKFPAFTREDGQPRFSGYKDFIIHYERAPGIGFLAGWRGKDGSKSLRGEPNPEQWERYIEHQGFFQYHLPESMRYYRFANKEYLEFAQHAGFNPTANPIVIELYSETFQRFRLAGQGLYDGPQPKDPADRERLARYFDPLPDFYEPLEQQRIDKTEYPFYAVNQRPMMMYHSWDSQNAWLRQIIAQNFLYMNRKKGEQLGIVDQSWVWVESHNGKIRVQVKLIEGCQEDTVWTWNAIGKQPGAWGLKPDAAEATKGFLMNHLISELLPEKQGERRITNSDPVTGQAAWYDLMVKVYPAAPGEEGVWPTFATIKPIPGARPAPDVLRYHTHQPVNLKS